MQQNSNGSQWSRLRIEGVRVYLVQFVTILVSVLNTLQFAHVETGQTSEDRVAVIKATTHQGISRQDSSLNNLCHKL